MSKREQFQNLVSEAETVDCGHYVLNSSEIIELANMFDNNFINGSYLLFKIGFLKGQRAEKARHKKKRQSLTA